MSPNDIPEPRRLAPRAIRIRNRCLATLASRRSLPVPSDEELSTLDDSVGLDEAFLRHERTHTPAGGSTEVATPTAPAPPPRRRRPWRSRTAIFGAALLVAALGIADRAHSAARVSGAEGSVPAPIWLPVTDSVARALRRELPNYAGHLVRSPMPLTAADLAALLLAPPRPDRESDVDSLEARIDSIVWIRGRLRGSRFELGGQVRLVRPRVAALRITHLTVGPFNVEPAAMPSYLRAIARGGRLAGTNELHVGIPASVAELSVGGGGARAILQR